MISLHVSGVQAAEQASRLEEVVVTAQRREEVAQSTPISLVSLNRENLQTLGINGIDDIIAQVPNFFADQFPANNKTLRLFIRGVGVTDVQITQDPAVGVYLDGVYIARSTGLATEIADLERIEVLRGPQGTLYGRNTTGGALNLVSRKPSTESLRFEQMLGVGNRDQRFIKSILNVPLGERHAVKFSLLTDSIDGFVSNEGPGRDFGDRDAEAYRFDWRWRVAENLTLDYSFDKSRIESHNYSPQAVIPGTESGTAQDEATLSAIRFVPFSDDRLEQMSTSVPLLPSDTSIEGHALTLEWVLPSFTFKSISAWRDMEDENYLDFAGGSSSEYRLDVNSVTLGANGPNPLRFEAKRTPLDHQQFSQELQILGEWNEDLQYVFGLYYFEEDAAESDLPMHHIFTFPLLAANDAVDVVNFRGEQNLIENEALAIYGQATWTPGLLDSRLHLSLGWRTSWDDRSVDRLFMQNSYIDTGETYIGPLEPIDFSASASRDFNDNSFTAMAEFDWSDSLVSYVKFVEAYKSGGFNTRDPDPDFFARGFDDEHNRTFELGFKGELADRRLRLNSAFFYSEFDDLQLNFLLPNSLSDTRVLNSGSATVSGVELEIMGYLAPGLLGRLDYAYLDSDIDDVINPFTGLARSFTFPNAPQNTLTLNFDYQLAPTAIGQPVLNLNYNYVDDRDGQNPNMDRGAFELLNARVSLVDIPFMTERFSLSAWVKNALEEDYVNFALDNLPHADRAVLWGEARRYGIELRYEFQ
ncbi:MAG: TonB-dependent receptor [Pseudomonadales bacterium]|nr:TonB-dependent receptor [Pseudomonadales bacterium]